MGFSSSDSFLAPIKYVSKLDPALDKSASKLAEYERTLDEKHLVFVDGAVPTRWMLRPLSRAQFLAVQATDGWQFVLGCVAFGVRAVDGWAHNGVPVQIQHDDMGELGERVKPDLLDKIYALNPELFKELGLVIMRRSSLRDRPL